MGLTMVYSIFVQWIGTGFAMVVTTNEKGNSCRVALIFPSIQLASRYYTGSVIDEIVRLCNVGKTIINRP